MLLLEGLLELEVEHLVVLEVKRQIQARPVQAFIQWDHVFLEGPKVRRVQYWRVSLLLRVNSQAFGYFRGHWLTLPVCRCIIDQV